MYIRSKDWKKKKKKKRNDHRNEKKISFIFQDDTLLLGCWRISNTNYDLLVSNKDFLIIKYSFDRGESITECRNDRIYLTNMSNQWFWFGPREICQADRVKCPLFEKGRGGEAKRTSAVVKSIIRIMKDDWSMFHFFLSFFFVFLFFLSLPKYDLYFRELYFSHKLLQFNVSTYITHYCVPSVSRQIVLKVGIQRLQVNLR